MSYSHDGLHFDVTDTGPLDGEVVVLLHGFPSNATSWDGLSALLHEAGYRTIAPDQRGYSPGARPRGRSSYRMSKLVGDTAALIRRIDAGPVHLVAHDWGAAIAWLTAANHPELVRTLTAISVSHPAAFTRAMVTGDQLRRSWYMFAFQVPFLPERILRGKRGDKQLAMTGLDEAGIARARAQIIDTDGLSSALNWYRALPFVSPRLVYGRKVTVPTTMIWGEDEVPCGRKGAELADRYVVGAPYSFHALAGVGHWIPDEVPEQVAEIVLTTWPEVSSPSRR